MTDKEKVFKDIGYCDFIEVEQDNLYRTKDYIITQKLSFTSDKDAVAVLISRDTFFRRTALRDKQYEYLCSFRKGNINGKRLKSSLSTRKVVF